MKAFSLFASVQVGIAAAATALFVAPPTAAAEDSRMIDFSKTDPAMKEAKAKARASIETFWTAYAVPRSNESGFALKVGFPTRGTNTEHIWISDVRRECAGRYSGRFANQPRDLDGKQAGGAIVSDWMFLRDGKWVGAETVRPMIARMPKEIVAHYRARFETP